MDHYTFPHITHISQVLAAIKDKEEFIVAERDRHTIVNYMVNTNTTFPRVFQEISGLCTDPQAVIPYTDHDASILRECRGIVFGVDGKVIARRLHKFFNIGERPETFLEDVDWKRPHHIVEKLDGSMITPIPIARSEDGDIRKGYTLRWGTKMGLTGVAMVAELFVADHPEYQNFANECIVYGNTPIFEWCTRKQRIVLDYPKDMLKLIAIRNNVTGSYVSIDGMHELCQLYKIPMVNWLPDDSVTNGVEFVDFVKNQEHIEGFVITFNDGHKLKVKTDWYCRIHRAKDSLLQEKRVVEMLINEKVDDVKPFLLENDLKKLEAFESDFQMGFLHVTQSILHIYKEVYHEANGDKKTFALASKDMESTTRGVIFNLWNTKVDEFTVAEELKRRILKHLGSQTKVDEARWMWHGAKWCDYIEAQDEVVA